MANIWFICNLGDAMLAGGALEQVNALFLAEYGTTDCPKDAAIFFRHESEGSLHCEVKVYFSPATANIARTFDAIPCKKPSVNGLGLLAGLEESWLVLFPENYASSTAPRTT